MRILLKDGVKYLPYKYEKEEELEEMVFEHYKDIFGENTVLLLKQKIQTSAGIGTIPDAFILSIHEKKWYIIEVELSGHPLYQHIVTQMTKFYNAIRNVTSRKELIKAFYNEVKNDPWKYALFQSNNINEIYKFISEVIDLMPDIVIVIDNESDELKDICNVLPFHSKIIVFRTFYRERVGIGDHIHSFEKIISGKLTPPNRVIKKLPQPVGSSVKIVDLIKEGYVNVGDKIYRTYKGKRYEGEILVDGKIKLENGVIVNSLSKAATYISGKSENGWIIWKYQNENGKIWLMDDLRRKFKEAI